MGCSNKRAVTLYDIIEDRELNRKYLQEESQTDGMPIDSD